MHISRSPGRALGRNARAQGMPERSTEPQIPYRGVWDRLFVRDPETDEELDLGPAWSTAWTQKLTLAANQADTAVFEFPADSGALITSIRAVGTSSAFTFAFTDVTDGVARPYQDRPIRGAIIFQTTAPPLRLWTPEGIGPGPVMLPPNARLECTLSDLSGASNTVFVTVEGLRLQRNRSILERLSALASETLFIHSTPESFTIPASGAYFDPFPKIGIAGGASFVMHQIACTQQTGWSLNMDTANNSEPWFNGDIPIENLIGASSVTPGGLTMPRGAAAGDTIRIKAASRTGGAIVVAQLALIGTKDWRGGRT